MGNTFQNIKEGIEGKPVSWYSDVFKIVFPNVNSEYADKLWEKELSHKELKAKKSKKKEQKRKDDEEESGEDDD